MAQFLGQLLILFAYEAFFRSSVILDGWLVGQPLPDLISSRIPAASPASIGSAYSTFFLRKPINSKRCFEILFDLLDGFLEAP